MADKTIRINIQSDADLTIKSVEDLKLELKALETQFETVAVGSSEFTRLGNEIKKTRSQLKDIDLQFEGLDKEQRATALVDTFNGLTGAVGAVSSAFIAFGAESGAIEDAEKKLLGIIGVVSGLRDVSNATVAANKLLGDSFSKAFTDATGAINGTKVALTSLGIGALIAGVTLLVTNFDALKEAVFGVGEGFDFTDTQLQELSKDAAKNIAEVEVLTATVQDQTLAEKDRQAALKQLQDQYPNYFKNLGDDINNTGLLDNAKKRLIDTLIREAKIRAATSKIEEIATKNIEDRLEIQADIDEANADILKNEQLIAKARAGFAATGLTAEQTLQGALNDREALQSRLGVVQGTLNKLNAEETAEIKKVTDAINIETAAIEKNGGTTKKVTEIKKEAVKEDKEVLKAAEDLRKQQELAAQLAKDNADEVAEILLTARQKEIEDIKDANQEKFELLVKTFGIESQEVKNLTILQNTEIADINAKYDAEELAKIEEKEQNKKDLISRIAEGVAVSEEQKRILEREKLIQYYDDLIADATKFGLDTTALNKAKNDALTKQNTEFIDEDKAKQTAYRENLQDLVLDSATSLLGDLKQLNSIFDSDNEEAAKKAFERNKSISIAETIISTYLAAQKAYTSQLTLTPDSPIRAQIAAAVAIASGLARVAVIKSTKFDGGGSAGGGGAAGGSAGSVGGGAGGSILNPFGTEGGGTNILPPRLAPPSGGGTQADTTGRFDQGIGQTPIIRTYVLAGDVTDAQVANEKINQKRKF
jgi:hypothetical protein